MKRCVLFGVFLALFLTQSIPFGQANTNWFAWGVESDTYTSYTANRTVAYFGASSRSTDTAHSGTQSMKLTVIGNDSGNQQLGADTQNWNTLPFNVVGSPPIYYRWWMKIMPGFSWGNGTQKTKSSRVLGSSVARTYTGYVRKTGFTLGECDGEGCTGDPGPVITYDVASMADGQWHEYIMEVLFNSTTASSDGQFFAWVDNVKVPDTTSGINKSINFALCNHANPNTFNEAWQGWMVSPYFQLNGTSSDGGTIYLDDFSTDSTFNSLLTGGGGPATATALRLRFK